MKKQKELTEIAEIKDEIARIDSRIAAINKTITQHLDGGRGILPLIKEELELKQLHWKLTSKLLGFANKLGVNDKPCPAIQVTRRNTNQYSS